MTCKCKGTGWLFYKKLSHGEHSSYIYQSTVVQQCHCGVKPMPTSEMSKWLPLIDGSSDDKEMLDLR